MKKALIIIGSILGVLLILLILIPVFFKDTIFRKVDEQLAKTINAEVYYDADNISLSLLRNFPNATAVLEDFSIVGREPFAGDTLLAAERFEVVIDIMSLINGDQMRIQGIELEKPLIQILVLEDGRANYDIAIEDEALPADPGDTVATEFNIGIDHWAINDGRIIYDDRSIPVRISLADVTHTGSGDFTQDIFEMDTYTLAEQSTLLFDGVEYIGDKRLEADVRMNMNLPEMKFTFLENTAKLNDFAMTFDGFIAMPEDPIIFDMNFAGKDNTFKSLLSLIPAIYEQDFDKVEASGEMDFNGYLRGVYSDADSTLPGYKVALQVNDARFKYEDLPAAVENINIDMLVEDPDGNPDNLYVNIKAFDMNVGKNPVKGRFELRSLEPLNIFADVDARLNLGELDQILKLQDLNMRGLFAMSLQADGIYDSIQNQFPKINAAMTLEEGYFKSVDYEVPIQDFDFNATIKNPTGVLSQTVVQVPAFNMLIGEDAVSGQLTLEDLNDYKWDLALKGTLDFTTISKIVEFEDMTLAGRIIANIETKGRMSAVEAGRYDQLPTSGTMVVKDFLYSSEDLPYDFLLSTAEMQFNPQSMVLENFNARIGETDMQLTGTVNNYIGYALKDDQVLKGQFNMVSRKVNLNQWMTDEEAPVAADTAGAPMEVIEIPNNLNLTFTSAIDEVIYDNLILKNMKGILAVENGILAMRSLTFNTLGGEFGLSGAYDPRDLQNPAFNMDFKIDNLSISRAYENFVTIQALAPIAEKLDGDFSTVFSLNGLLGQDMVPLMGTLTGGGIVELIDATLKNSQTLNKVMGFTKLQNNATAVQLKDVLLKAKVDDGFVVVEPFNFKVGDIDIEVGGRQGIDGVMDYRFALDVPAGVAGQAVNNLLASVGAGSGADASTIKLNLGVGGTYEDPKVSLLGAGPGAGEGGVAATVKEAAKEKVEAQIDKAKEELEEKRREAEARAKAELEEKKRQAEEQARIELERRKQQVQDSLKKKSKGVLRDLLKNR